MFKIQHLLLSRAVFMYMAKKKLNCCSSVKELWIFKGSTVQEWVLLHHLAHGQCGRTPTVLLTLLSSTCCKYSPWVRKKKIPFWSFLQLLSNYYQTLRDFSPWHTHLSTCWQVHEEHTSWALGWPQPQQQHVPPHLSNLFPAAASLHVSKPLEQQRHSKARMCWWWDF